MAVTASGLYYIAHRDIYLGGNANLTSDTVKCALHTNSLTPNFDTDSTWSNTAEVSGTGYTTGGATLANDAFSVSSGTLIYDADDTAWTTSTFSSARCAVIWDDTASSPAADPRFCLVNFGADFAVTAGTFTIQWAAGGIWSIDLTP